MRYSVAQLTATALLGLSQIFLGANGAPTSLTQARDVSHPCSRLITTSFLSAPATMQQLTRSYQPLNVEHPYASPGLIARAGGPGKGGDPGKEGDPSKSGDPGKTGGEGSKGGSNAVVNIETRGYKVGGPTKDGSDDAYKVRSMRDDNDEEGVQVALIRVNKNDGSITVDDARLAKDEETGDPGDPKGEADRARLWEIEMSLFIHNSGMQPTDLNAVYAEQVSEKRSVTVIADARKQKGIEDEEPFEVSKDSDGIDKEIFDNIMNEAGFGRSMQDLLRKVPVGKEVQEIHVGPPQAEDDFSLGFILK